MDAPEPTLLPYETPRESPRVRIERFPDGGVTATLRPTERDFYTGLGPWLCVALGGAAATVMLASLAPALQTPIFAIGGGFVAVAMFFVAFHAARTGKPIVIGVSPKGVYIDYPKWLVRRRRYFRREEILVVQPVTWEKLMRGQRRSGVFEHFLEVQIRYGPSLRVLNGPDKSAVVAVAGALRDALGMDQPTGPTSPPASPATTAPQPSRT